MIVLQIITLAAVIFFGISLYVHNNTIIEVEGKLIEAILLLKQELIDAFKEK